MRSGRFCAAIVCTELCLFAQAATADQVFVRAGKAFGRGLTRAKNGACFVIVPDHVVASSATIRIVAFGGKTAAAAVRYSDDQNMLIRLLDNRLPTPLGAFTSQNKAARKSVELRVRRGPTRN